MRESEKIFEDIFKKELEPTLLELGFSRYCLPKGWIQPSFLFNNNTHNIWFGCSWDWRDFYFEAELGSLYRFKDVLPRIIVCGFVLEKKSQTKYTSEYITDQINNAKRRIIDLANKNFEKYYEFILIAQSKKIQRLKMYIEKEISSKEELPFAH
ncbi:hypothetical protein LPY66_15325 [Dehalobacter sp. DCM]|uniref:hypothetical protein n=1 Tax=Dehalobacter sp. DCM TaxID=2907827 RepID=UPI0030815BDC|nr:hypothetical protein LPY66_15325 [Dehalobacter sp. DCM]